MQVHIYLLTYYRVIDFLSQVSAEKKTGIIAIEVQVAILQLCLLFKLQGDVGEVQRTVLNPIMVFCAAQSLFSNQIFCPHPNWLNIYDV